VTVAAVAATGAAPTLAEAAITTYTAIIGYASHAYDRNTNTKEFRPGDPAYFNIPKL
jgi:hypothetical protein